MTATSALALAFAGSVLVATPAAAATFTATNETELAQAITDANTSNGVPDTITVSGTIALGSDLPAVTDHLTIVGDAGSSIEAAGHRAFHDSGATPNIDLTFTNVHVTNASFAIETDNSNVTITTSTFENAPVSIGGATITVEVSDSQFVNSVSESGLLVHPTDGSQIILIRVTASGNSTSGIIIIDDEDIVGAKSLVGIGDSTITANSDAGVVAAGGTLEILVHRTTISGNGGSSGIGGVMLGFFAGSSLTLHSSTVSDNSGELGGLFAMMIDGTPSITMVNSTVSGNSTLPGNGASSLSAGGVTVLADVGVVGTVAVSHSTVVNNSAYSDEDIGGLTLAGAQYTIDHNILAGNTNNGAPTDLALLESAGAVTHSLVQVSENDALTAVDAGTGNLKNVSALLGPLTNNGGLTLTHLPSSGSPVIDAGNAAITGAPTTDQRDQPRIVGTIDLGAVELAGAAGGGPTLAATGIDAAPFIVAGGALLALGGIIVVLVARRRHTTR